MLKPVKAVIRRAVQWLPVHHPWWTKLDLLKTLVQRDLEARYKGSVLGNLWSLINQIAQLLVYMYLFSIVLHVKLDLKGLPANNFTYGLWLFAGLIPWIAFTSGFMQGSSSVVGQPNLVKKVIFPLALLPLVPVMSAFIESSLGLMALIAFVAFTTQTVHSTLWLFPLVWIPQLLITAGLSYLAAGLTVFLRDIPQTIAILINLWFYMTPIVYPASVVPEFLRFWVFWLNPLSAIAEMYRDLVLVGDVHHWAEWGVASGTSVVIFCLGVFVYQRLRPSFADVL